MTSVLLYYLAVLLGLGAYAYFFLRTDGWRKWIGLPGYGLLVLVSLYSGLLSLGHPADSRLVFDKEELVVVGVFIVDGKGIYIWALRPDSDEPINIKLPWDQQKASETAGAMEEAREQDGLLIYKPDADSVFAEKKKEVPKKGNDEPLRGENQP